MKNQLNISHKTDADLLKCYKSDGELEVLGSLYQRYIHLVYGVALKYLKNRDDAQDTTMQIFEELVDKLLKHEVDNFKSWLHVLTRNHCLMKLRKQTNHSVSLEDGFMENAQLEHHDNETTVLEENIVKLEKCIEQLKDEQKQCVKLFYLGKRSYKEVEQMTSLPLKKVKSHIQNGKRNLKTCIESSE